MSSAPRLSQTETDVESVCTAPPRSAALRREEFPLIVHADDFGETVQITEGIRLGIEAGVLTSTSILANMEATDHAVFLARGLAERASFGVHLNLCEGRPMTFAPGLMGQTGRFHSKRILFARAACGMLRLRELEAEISAQIARIRDGGVRISHVDGHKHLHQLPVVSTAVANVLPRFAIRRVRITRVRRLRATDPPASLVRELLAWQGSRIFERAGLRSPVRTVDLRTLMSADATGTRGESIIDSEGAVELCCHPGTVAADVDKPGSHRRSAELDYLLSPGFRDLLRTHHARLVTYWQV